MSCTGSWQQAPCSSTRVSRRTRGRRAGSAAAALVSVSSGCVDLGAGNARKRVLNGINFSLKPGELHMLVGPNGCGKLIMWHKHCRHNAAKRVPRRVLDTSVRMQSTLLRVIGGLTALTSGQAHVDGPCAFVFQNPDHQVVMPTVAAEVALGTGQQGLSGAALVERVVSALRRMRMEEFAEVATATLSGGQKQRLAIATALAQGPPAPKVLLLDELTTFLDADDAATVLSAVCSEVSRDSNVAAVWVTHRLEELFAADSATYMEAGNVVVSGRPGRVLRHLRAMGATV